MPNGIPEPALQPLHPEKPEPPIVAGYVWQKIASGKTSVNAPRIQVQRTINGRIRRIAVRQVFPLPGPEYTMTERVFRRDWRPCYALLDACGVFDRWAR